MPLIILLVFAKDIEWQYPSFVTSGSNSVNSRNVSAKQAGVSGPMQTESIIPEALKQASADEIFDNLKDTGFNWIRMSYTFQMMNEVLDNDGKDSIFYYSLAKHDEIR